MMQFQLSLLQPTINPSKLRGECRSQILDLTCSQLAKREMLHISCYMRAHYLPDKYAFSSWA